VDGPNRLDPTDDELAEVETMLGHCRQYQNPDCFYHHIFNSCSSAVVSMKTKVGLNFKDVEKRVKPVLTDKEWTRVAFFTVENMWDKYHSCQFENKPKLDSRFMDVARLIYYKMPWGGIVPKDKVAHPRTSLNDVGHEKLSARLRSKRKPGKGESGQSQERKVPRKRPQQSRSNEKLSKFIYFLLQNVNFFPSYINRLYNSKCLNQYLVSLKQSSCILFANI